MESVHGNFTIPDNLSNTSQSTFTAEWPACAHFARHWRRGGRNNIKRVRRAATLFIPTEQKIAKGKCDSIEIKWAFNCNERDRQMLREQEPYMHFYSVLCGNTSAYWPNSIRKERKRGTKLKAPWNIKLLPWGTANKLYSKLFLLTCCNLRKTQTV